MKVRLVFSDFAYVYSLAVALGFMLPLVVGIPMALLYYNGRLMLYFNGFGEGWFEFAGLIISCLIIIAHIVGKLRQ